MGRTRPGHFVVVFIDGSVSPGMEQRIAMAYCMMDEAAIGVKEDKPGSKRMIMRPQCHQAMAKGVF